MATMYIERSGTCRRRASSGDVIEPWFLLSRSAYQRILDVALADMTSAEVLQRASRGSELLRLLSTGDDVTTQMSRQQPATVDVCDKSRVAATPRNVSDKSDADVCAKSPEVRPLNTRQPSNSLPLSLVSNQIPVAADCRRRLDKDSAKHWQPEADARNHVIVTSSKATALCLRVPSYVRSQHAATISQSQSGGKRRRPVAETEVVITPPDDDVVSDRNCDVVDTAATQWRSSASATTHVVDDDSTSANDDASPPERSQQQTDKPETDESRCRKNEQKSSKDQTRKRKSVRQPEAEMARMGACEGDGWAPIDKDILVGIVERLSVSCLQPPPTRTPPSSSSSSVGAEVATAVSTSSSQSEFRQPLTLTAPRRGDPGRTAAVDVTKRAAMPTQPLVMSSPCRSVQSPPHKSQRLASTSPWSPVLTSRNCGGRRKSTFQRRVQVRDTWSVPSRYKSLQSRSATDTVALQHPRHVWAPLDKSVVLNVLDHILVDSDGDDECGEVKRRCDQSSSSRRRYLQPPSLRALTTAASPSPTATDARTASPVTSAAEASFKWKSNILRRMRKEQTVMASSGGHWTGPVAATGS